MTNGYREWEGFTGRPRKEEISTRDFIQDDYKPYDGGESLLAGPTETTDKLQQGLQKLQKEERVKNGILDMETEVASSLTSYGPGYIKDELKDLEAVVGLQTSKSLKRAFIPYGSIKVSEEACMIYGYEPSEKLHEIFHEYHKAHNDVVFDCYAPEMRLARRNRVVTGLPDIYRRGRIVGDYRRITLYGIDYLIEQKQRDKANYGCGVMSDGIIRQREGLAEQIKTLEGMRAAATLYNFDISGPATTTKGAAQWLYFDYLAAIRIQNGAAMSVGRVSTSLNIYVERDLEVGILTESEAQELIDHMTIRSRMVKFVRIPSCSQLFFGDPVWAILGPAGLGMDGYHMITRSDLRFLHTLESMGPTPEPNLVVLCSSRLPEDFKTYSVRISIEASSVQYENDDTMCPVWDNDYAVCYCVGATQTGKGMQSFGACVNPAKRLLYAINGGVDEKTKAQVGPEHRPITSEYPDYDEVMYKCDDMMEWLVNLYVSILSLIQYTHDKYYYESSLMALIGTDVRRTLVIGIAGLPHIVDPLAAIKYIKAKMVRDEDGLVIDYEIEGDFPHYENDDGRADNIAVWLLRVLMEKIEKRHTYRDSKPTTSILIITSSVVYGKATGTLPDGREAGEPLLPGANPPYDAGQNGPLASLNSVIEPPCEYALDGIGNMQTISSDAFGHNEDKCTDNLIHVLDGYSDQGVRHLNVNVFDIEKLHDAMERSEKREHASFTIRVPGYAVRFVGLTHEQQLDVIPRACHASL